MGKRVVVHHAHHPEEGVYRLIHAQCDEHMQVVEVENPNYNAGEANRLQLGIGLYEHPTGNGGPTTSTTWTNLDPEANGHSNGKTDSSNGNGIPVLGSYAQPPQFDPEVHSPTKMVEQAVPVYSDHQDIIWADWDEQWKGLSDDEIAAKQRQMVKDVFAARESEQQEALAKAAADMRHIGQTEVEL